MKNSGPDLTVVIPTRNRSTSLAHTLEQIARTDRTGLDVTVTVVSNASEDDTESVVKGCSHDLQTSLLHEPRVGKAHALNRAINESRLGKLVAVLDDDMSPDVQWRGQERCFPEYV